MAKVRVNNEQDTGLSVEVDIESEKTTKKLQTQRKSGRLSKKPIKTIEKKKTEVRQWKEKIEQREQKQRKHEQRKEIKGVKVKVEPELKENVKDEPKAKNPRVKTRIKNLNQVGLIRRKKAGSELPEFKRRPELSEFKKRPELSEFKKRQGRPVAKKAARPGDNLASIAQTIVNSNEYLNSAIGGPRAIIIERSRFVPRDNHRNRIKWSLAEER